METPNWVLVHQNTSDEKKILKPRIQAGRSNTLDIVCLSNIVSRNHAEFYVYPDGTLHVKDMQSSNGTYVNHQRIESNRLHQLYVNDEVGLGLHSNLNIAALGPEHIMDVKYIFIVKKSDDGGVLDDTIENISSDTSLENNSTTNQNGVENFRNSPSLENGLTNNQNTVENTNNDPGLGNNVSINQNTVENIRNGPGLENDLTDNQNIVENMNNDFSFKNNVTTDKMTVGDMRNGTCLENGLSNNQNTVENINDDHSLQNIVTTHQNTGIRNGLSLENGLTNNPNIVENAKNGPSLQNKLTDSPLTSQKLLDILDSDDEVYEVATNAEFKINYDAAPDETKSTAQQRVEDKPVVVASTSSENHLTLENNLPCKTRLKNGDVHKTKGQQESTGNCGKIKTTQVDVTGVSNSESRLKSESVHEKDKQTATYANLIIKQEPVDVSYVSNYQGNDYTIEDGCIIINDDDEFPCSQLLIDNSNLDNHNQGVLSDSIFCLIKKELEELDRPEDGRVYAYVDLSDSDTEGSQDWISDLKNNLNKGDDENKNFQTSPEQSDIKKGDVNDIASSSTMPHSLGKKKYLIPPVISPHVETRKNHKSERLSGNKAPEKRRLPEKENELAKKIKTDTFYDKKVNSESAWKRKRPETVMKETKEHIHEIRRKKLKEIADKKHEEKETKTTRSKTATAKVKVSDSRGKFLTENYDNMPSTSKGRSTSTSTSRRAKNRSTATNSRSPISSKDSSKPLLSCTNPQPQPTYTNHYNTIAHDNNLLHNSNRIHDSSPTDNNNLVRNSNLTRSCELSHKNNFVHHPKLMPAVPQSVIPTHTTVYRNNDVPKSCEGIEDIIIRFLNWKAVWFQRWKEKRIPPPLHDQPLSRMCRNFSTYSDYYKTVMPLLEQELWNHVEKGFEENNDPRKKKFIAQIQYEKKMDKYTQLDCITYITQEQNNNVYHLKEEDAVIVQFKIRKNEVFTIPLMGYVTQVNKRLLQVGDFIDEDFGKALGIAPHGLIYFKILVEPYNGTVVLEEYMHIRIVTSLVASARVFRSVKYLEYSPLCQRVLKPTFALYKVPSVPNEKLFSRDNLNTSQYQAVMEATHMCLRPEPSIYLIQGPPGTGKSTVIINIIQQILFRELNRNSSTQCCILVVAPSNAAVDELTLRLIKLKLKLEAAERKEVKLVRLGPKNMIHPAVQDYSLYELAKRNLIETFLKPESNNATIHSHLLTMQQNIATLKENCKTPEDEFKLNAAKVEFDKACRQVMGRSWNESFRKTEEVLLNKARIICTTLSSCIGLRMQEVFGGSSKKIRCCIVDEATQSREQEALIPLKLGIDKLVLVGDPKQLPAVTLSKEAKNCAHGQSLFSRIMSHFEGSPNNPIRMLDIQYRMHPMICEFPNKTYYDGKLKSAAVLKTRSSKLNILKPYLVFNFVPDHLNSQEYQNSAEIECVIKLLDAIVLNIKESCAYTVGIITPYNDQKNGIKAKIKERTFRPNISITVNTVDSFQGQEKDIIIMSYVRDYTNNFVSDEQRLNVAITRAMYALYIIGSDHLLRTCATLGKIYDDAKRRYLIKGVNCRTSMLSLSYMIKK